MSRKKIIIKNTISNIGMQFISSMLPFLILPYMLRYWGKETYGILVLAYSVLTFMFFLNGAIGMTLMKYVSEVYETKDFIRLNTIINDFWVVAFLNNLIASLILMLAGSFALHWLNISDTMINITKHVFYVMGVFGIISGMFSFIDGVMYGLQKIHENNLFRLAEAVLNAAAAITVLITHQNLVTYVFLISIIPILVRTVQFFYLKRILPQFDLNIVRYFSFSELIKLSKFSSYQIANQVSDILMYNTDKIIIQKIMGLSWVTMYEVSNKPNLLFQNFISLPLSAILPACSAAYARNDKDFLEKMLITGTKIYLISVLPVIFAFIFTMKSFIYLWLGEGYSQAVPGAQIFLWALAIGSPFKVLAHMMVSKARILEYGMTKFIYAIINVPLSVFFVWKWGIIGGIIVTLGFWLFVHIPTNLYIMSQENISSAHFFKCILPVGIMILIQTVAINLILHAGFGSSWFELGCIILFSILITVFLSLFFVINKEERALMNLRF